MTIAQLDLNVLAILPQLIVLAAAAAILLLDAFWDHADKVPLAVIALVAHAAAYCAAFRLWDGVGFAFAGTVVSDGYALFFDFVLLIAAALSILLSLDYTRRMRIARGEYYALLLLATAGAMVMASAADLIIAFIGLEMLSIALYLLAGFARGDRRSQEAALKYFLLGAFASAFFLYGIALACGATGSTNLAGIAASWTPGA